MGAPAAKTGVLDFNATEGMVAVPPLVARNLFGDGAGTPPDGATVTVTYRRLPKGALLLVHTADDTRAVYCRV